MTAFGKLLREERQKAKKTMGELGRHLGVSVPFISDVELGRRPPLSVDRIKLAAEYFGIDPQPLLAAAVSDRGSIELQAAFATPKKVQVGAGLMRRWADLTDEDLEKIERILGDSSGTKHESEE